MVWVDVSITISSEDRGDHHAAWIDGIGTTVYAENYPDAFKRAEQMMDFIFGCFYDNTKESMEQFCAFLDNHNIKYSIVDEDDAASNSPRQVQKAFAFA